MKVTKILMALAGATVLLGALVSAASANRLSNSSQTIRGTWTSAEFSGGFGTPRCSLTIEGSLHSATIPKTTGLLVGYVTRASIGPCANGNATLLTATLPWHLQYSGFGGSLPAISSFIARVIGASWLIRETGGISCLSRSEANHPAIATLALNSGSVMSLTLSGTMSSSCGFEGTLRGTSNTNSANTITLI